MEKKKQILWSSDFEIEHFPCTKEWWCTEGFFTTIENNKKWSFAAVLYQEIMEKNFFSAYYLTVFDLDDDKTYGYKSTTDTLKLESIKDKFYIKYQNSYMKGTFPTYQMFFNNPEKNMSLNLKYKAKSSPYWVAQQITNGWLPWGLGYYRYGFIPKNDLQGTIIINNNKYTLKGKGYFDHVWGDFSFLSLLKSGRSIKTTISTYMKLIGWWIHNQTIKIPKSIMFSSDNSPFGYDWCWAILDNGWSLFFGNIIFWIAEGPAIGILILSKNGTEYNEFSNITFRNITMKYLPEYDFYYPIELEIIAKKGNEKIFLHFKKISGSYEDIYKTSEEKNLIGSIVCQIPCNVVGYYLNGIEKIIISGKSNIELFRLLRMFGHNTLKFDFKIYPNCLGLISSFNSHYFGKKIDINLQLLPKLKLKLSYKKYKFI